MAGGVCVCALPMQAVPVLAMVDFKPCAGRFQVPHLVPGCRLPGADPREIMCLSAVQGVRHQGGWCMDPQWIQHPYVASELPPMQSGVPPLAKCWPATAPSAAVKEGSHLPL